MNYVPVKRKIVKIDRLWELASSLTVTVREAFGGANPRQVIMRALYTDDEFNWRYSVSELKHL